MGYIVLAVVICVLNICIFMYCINGILPCVKCGKVNFLFWWCVVWIAVMILNILVCVYKLNELHLL